MANASRSSWATNLYRQPGRTPACSFLTQASSSIAARRLLPGPARLYARILATLLVGLLDTPNGGPGVEADQLAASTTMPRSPTPSNTPSVWVDTLWAWPTLTRRPTQASGISCSDMPASLEHFSYRMRLWHRVSAMPEVAACVLGADRTEGLFGGLEQSLKYPRLRPPQQGLHLGEGLLYGVEVRRVGW